MNYSSFSSQELLQECVTRADAEAWEEFVCRFQPLIAGVVARTAMRWTEVSPGLVDDLVQETYLKLCTDHFRRLREFENRFEDAIYGFLKAIAYNVTMDYFKVRHATKRGSQLLSKSEFDTALQTVAQEDSVEDRLYRCEGSGKEVGLAATSRTNPSSSRSSGGPGGSAPSSRSPRTRRTTAAAPGVDPA